MNYFNDISKEAQTELVQFTINGLKDISDNTCVCDIHHELFNTDYYIIGTYQAKEWLEKHIGAFEAIGIIKEYETDNFGEKYTDLSEPENVVNMLVYIIGEEILNSSEEIQDKWDDDFEDIDLELVIEQLNELV